ncbi:hypothetical protein V1264_022030 [Littorina saxatilis]|uniref:Uncharacterized protein n=1 Tax=Littorina saxatilis TaxID=31220 RepID=A0AAN9AJM1_9CAEN
MRNAARNTSRECKQSHINWLPSRTPRGWHNCDGWRIGLKSRSRLTEKTPEYDRQRKVNIRSDCRSWTTRSLGSVLGEVQQWQVMEKTGLRFFLPLSDITEILDDYTMQQDGRTIFFTFPHV